MIIVMTPWAFPMCKAVLIAAGHSFSTPAVGTWAGSFLVVRAVLCSVKFEDHP